MGSHHWTLRSYIYEFKSASNMFLPLLPTILAAKKRMSKVINNVRRRYIYMYVHDRFFFCLKTRVWSWKIWLCGSNELLNLDGWKFQEMIQSLIMLSRPFSRGPTLCSHMNFRRLSMLPLMYVFFSSLFNFKLKRNIIRQLISSWQALVPYLWPSWRFSWYKWSTKKLWFQVTGEAAKLKLMRGEKEEHHA